MGLTLPTVSSTAGPAYATQNNAAFTLLDSHDHSSGKGAQIPASALNINADLSFAGYNAYLLRSTRYSAQSAVLAAAADLGCIYSVNGDLYWNNSSGTAVRITDGAAISGASTGSITGLPSGTAGVAFATATYTFTQATNRAATLDAGALVIRDTAVGPLNGITLQSPASLASAYSLTLPAALPGATSFVTLTSAGVLAAGAATSAGITRAMQASVGQQVSSSSTTFSGSSTTFASVTNLTVTITTTGRPIVLECVSDDNGTVPAQFALTIASSSGGRSFDLRFSVTGSATTTIGRVQMQAYFGSNAEGFSWPPSALRHVYVAAAGTYTFQAQYLVSVGTATLAASYMKLVAWEL